MTNRILEKGYNYSLQNSPKPCLSLGMRDEGKKENIQILMFLVKGFTLVTLEFIGFS